VAKRCIMIDQPFIGGESKLQGQPLQEYLPSYHPGLVSSWLKTLPTFSGLVLFPFGSSPQAMLEAARAGFRVLAPISNPISRLLISGLAHPPTRDALNATLAHLASEHKGDERLKPHILSLYATECPKCGASMPAQAFTWSRERGEPITKSCRCSHCAEDTLGPVSQDDIARALTFRGQSPTLARALTRVTAPDDPLRVQVEIALHSYPGRSVYALLSLFNKLTGFDLDASDKKLLELLLLQACYLASSPLSRRKAESDPGASGVDHYREVNVWYALEDALEVWPDQRTNIPLVSWPELPPTSGGLSIYEGRVRELLPQLQGQAIETVMMVFPKPSLSFWALSALWTGWLWGQDAAAPMRSILSLKSNDWIWINRGIRGTLQEIKSNLPESCPFLGLLPDLEREYLLASFSAASAAGLSLESLALETDLEVAQTRWLSTLADREQDIPGDLRKSIRTAALDLLREAAEPKHTLSLYGAGLAALCRKGFPGDNADPGIYFPQLVRDFEENIAYRQGFLHYPDPDIWWHQELTLSPESQVDIVEQLLVDSLVKSSRPQPSLEVFQELYCQLPGLNTPPQSLVQVCLNSYGENLVGSQGGWVLKASERPEKRLADMQEMKEILTEVGSELGFTVNVGQPLGGILHLTWATEVASHYSFFISASGLLAKILLGADPDLPHPWIILPGSRAGLIHYKMAHNPPLAERLNARFGLVKYRHLRQLAEQGGVTHTNLQERLSLDPFTSESPQLPLI
jgi:hypothetical protein